MLCMLINETFIFKICRPLLDQLQRPISELIIRKSTKFQWCIKLERKSNPLPDIEIDLGLRFAPEHQ